MQQVVDRASRARRGRGRPWALTGRVAVVMSALVALGSALVRTGATAAPPTAGAAVVASHALTFTETWSQTLPDAGGPIAESSPSEATLDGSGPSVVVGDRDGNLWAFHLSNGTAPAGWPVKVGGGAPVDSTASTTPDGGGTDDVFIGGGNAADPHVGGYFAFGPTGQALWGKNATDPNGNQGVQASMAVGTLNGVKGVVAPSLGQDEYALNAANGTVLAGWPFFTADSGFTTPSLADLYGNGQTEVVEGGDSTAGIAYGQTYANGGHLRVLSAGGNLLCEDNPNQTVDSSTAVGNFLGGSAPGIAFGTGSYYGGVSDTDALFAANSSCGIVWRDVLGGTTGDSPALGDLYGDSNLEVLEGADPASGGGLVYALNGANGAVEPGWPKATPDFGQIIGGIVTADLTGAGYNDVLVPTTAGLVIYDGRTGNQVALLGNGAVALQNSPMVTVDPNGTIGITIAGYNGLNQGVVQHYEIGGSTGRSLGQRAWPMFHQNPQLTGWLNQPGPAHLNAPVVGMAPTADGKGYWEVGGDGGVFSYGDAAFHGSEGGQHLNAPIVGMAPTPDGKGYWLVASDGGIFAFGDAGFYGSEGGKHLNAPIVGMAPTPDGKGYWLVASDGGIFAFGDAGFHGSMGGSHLNAPVVGMAAGPGGNGYWLVASDGGIFAFGSAGYHGSMGGSHLNAPVVGMAAGPGGNGYWLVAADGGIFSFGSSGFDGSEGGAHLNAPIVGMAAGPGGSGYWFTASDGGIFSFGGAGFYGSVPGTLAQENDNKD